MKIAINWYEVTLPTHDLAVPMQSVALQNNSESTPRHPHRVLQRRTGNTVTLLHVTDSPPPEAEIATLRLSEDPNFVKLVVEESFSRRLTECDFEVSEKHVGRTAYRPTTESLWADIYSFRRGLEFRAFYFMGETGFRWGIVLNYATSQRFSLSLDDHALRKLAIGKRVARVSGALLADDEQQRRSGILISVTNNVATIDVGTDRPLRDSTSNWTLICRRELLVDYVSQTKGAKDAAELTRRLQQASFSLTESGRMNTSLAKSQSQAIQQVLRQYDLSRLILPLPNNPPATLSSQPLIVAE